MINDGVQFGDFKITSQHINRQFTGYDAVIMIKTPEINIIHAFDNYHAWPDNMISDILRECQGYRHENIYLLIQFGVADCLRQLS